jgi:hypothetical protein
MLPKSTLHLANGDVVEADLVIGVDGVHVSPLANYGRIAYGCSQLVDPQLWMQLNTLLHQVPIITRFAS